MSGETQRNESGWTVDTSREDLLSRIDCQEKLFDRRFTDQNEAVKTANAANDKRFEGVNEFRAQLSDQVNTFLPRKEYDARHETLENRVTELTDRLNRSDGQDKGSDLTRSDMYKLGGFVISVLGLIILLANKVF